MHNYLAVNGITIHKFFKLRIFIYAMNCRRYYQPRHQGSKKESIPMIYTNNGHDNNHVQDNATISGIIIYFLFNSL